MKCVAVAGHAAGDVRFRRQRRQYQCEINFKFDLFFVFSCWALFWYDSGASSTCMYDISYRMSSSHLAKRMKEHEGTIRRRPLRRKRSHTLCHRTDTADMHFIYNVRIHAHTHTPFEVTLRWINETWIARKKCLEAFESEKKYCRDIRKFENLAFRNRFRAAKKKKLCYIACLILSLIFRLCEMAAAAVAARRHRRLIEKHISALYTIFFFIIFLLLFFSLVIVSVGLGVRVSLSHTLFIRSFSSRISFAYFIGVWWCGDAVGLCLVVLNSASSSSCVSFLRVEFISTQRYTFIISIRIRLGDRSSLPQFVCAKALHSTRRYNIPFSITHYYFPFWFGYMFRYIFYLRSFFVLPKSFAPFCDKHR